eukprot:SAG31_NODE_20475_length_573_cov_1.065401_1_plen_156_part_01
MPQDDWLDAILRSTQTRGRLQSINQALEEDARDGPSGGEVSRDSSVMAPMSGVDQAALQAKMRAAEEVDEEDAEGYAAGGTGAEDEIVTGDLGHEHINPDEISNAAALQAQLAKENFGAIDRKGPAQVDAHNIGALMEQHQQEMEIRQKEMEMEMK